MDKRNFAFDRTNFILLAVGMAVVVAGFILMSGSGSTDTTYDPEIFSARRIKVAPAVCLAGFVSIVYAIVRRPKDTGAAATGSNAETEKEAKDELV